LAVLTLLRRTEHGGCSIEQDRGMRVRSVVRWGGSIEEARGADRRTQLIAETVPMVRS
jgi:hypothetical protein